MTSNALAVDVAIRHKRIAFLVDASAVTNEQVDEIISYNCRHWGGRFNPIIPIDDSSISEEWWQLLVAVDPDIIYSLLPLSDAVVDRINREILPSRILEPRDASAASLRGPGGGAPFDVPLLGVDEIPRYVAEQRNGWRAPFFCVVKDSRPTKDLRAYALRNFGVLPAGRPTQSMFDGLPHFEIDSESATAFEYLEVADKFQSDKLLFPIDLCSQIASPSFSPSYDQRVRGFRLVVGDSPWEAIYCWNLRLARRSAVGRDYLWLPSHFASNEELLAKVGLWIARSYGGGSDERLGFVVTYGVSASDVQDICRSLSEHSRLPFTEERLASSSYPFPKLQSPVGRDSPLSSQTETMELASREQLPLSDGKIMVRLYAPPFSTERTADSGWMLELGIAFRPELFFYTNVRPKWTLPKRLGLTRLFVEQGGPRGRVSFRGRPSFEVSAGDDVLEVKIPSDHSIFWVACFERHSSNRASQSDQPRRPARFADFVTSDKGRHIRGVISLFGTVFHLRVFFSDPFWRRAFYLLADKAYSDESEQTRVSLVKEKVSGWISKRGGFPETSEAVHELCGELASSLTFREGSSQSLTVSGFKGLFSRLRGEALNAGSPDSYWRAYTKFDALKMRELSNLVSQRVLMQGMTLRCPHCFTTRWHGVEDLGQTIGCESCMSSFQLPLDGEWSFRLNALVINVIRYHGAEAVLQTLCYLEDRASFRGAFQYLPAQDIFEHEVDASSSSKEKIQMKDGRLAVVEGRLFSDVDLLYVGAGRFGLVEVKSRPAGFSAEELQKLKVIASELRPDDLILAAGGDHWPADVKEQIELIASQLALEGVTVEKLLVSWNR
jgi:hypothetical protein